jgi:catechol 2,3-dioxygenase-like lactoylglutathione lyase family enzyme
MTLRPNGMHHIAICTARMKDQIEFFTDVLGARLVALYWMHGTEGAWHGFLELSASSTVAFVQHPDVKDKPQTLDLSHARTPGHFTSAGTMQHLALNVDNDEDLLAMRDRIRSRGIVTFGPIDHGMCKSIYFAGLEGLNLEVSTSREAIDPARWIDRDVLEMAGISNEELQRFVNPAEFRAASPVPQPARDHAKPHMHYPEEIYQALLGMSDEEFVKLHDWSAPPANKASIAA